MEPRPAAVRLRPCNNLIGFSLSRTSSRQWRPRAQPRFKHWGGVHHSFLTPQIFNYSGQRRRGGGNLGRGIPLPSRLGERRELPSGVYRAEPSHKRLWGVSCAILMRFHTSLSTFNMNYHHHHHHHPHHHHTTKLTWCKHSSASGPRYKVTVTHAVSVRKS